MLETSSDTSHDHQLYTIEFTKTGLSAWNDKRVIYRDGDKFYSLPLGHYLTSSGLSDKKVIEYLKTSNNKLYK